MIASPISQRMDKILSSFQLKMLHLSNKHNTYKIKKSKIDSSKTIVEFPDRIFHSQQHIEVDKFHVQPQNNSLVVLPRVPLCSLLMLLHSVFIFDARSTIYRSLFEECYYFPIFSHIIFSLRIGFQFKINSLAQRVGRASFGKRMKKDRSDEDRKVILFVFKL